MAARCASSRRLRLQAALGKQIDAGQSERKDGFKPALRNVNEFPDGGLWARSA
jgi:hypothetical protein